MFYRLIPILSVLVFISPSNAVGPTLVVKAGRSAIVKTSPSGNAQQVTRLNAGTCVERLAEVPRYYSIRLSDGSIGWSYKGNFDVSECEFAVSPEGAVVTRESLLARPDVLKIVVLDVEVGDATLIFCPEEDGKRDVVLIDTGENDADRIREALVAEGFVLSEKPITRFVITHYDRDHFGDAWDIIPISKVVYDHGDNIKKKYRRKYHSMVDKPNVDRRVMTLEYHETFTGGVTIECVAVNQATDFEPDIAPSPAKKDNPNSIALIVSWEGFDYFTGGDLTKKAEKSLATGQIRNCDAYHVNHHGSRATSSLKAFVEQLDPEVSIASNGTSHGHPTADVANRLLGIGSKFYQTNFNPDSRAHHPPPKYVADDTYFEDEEEEDAEGAVGTITVVVDPAVDSYYVVMPGLPLSEATFPIEH